MDTEVASLILPSRVGFLFFYQQRKKKKKIMISLVLRLTQKKSGSEQKHRQLNTIYRYFYKSESMCFRTSLTSDSFGSWLCFASILFKAKILKLFSTIGLFATASAAGA